MATLMDHLDGLTNEQLRRIILDMCVKKDTNEERIVNIIRQWNDKTSPEEHEGPQAKRRRPADDAGSVPPKATTPSVTAGNTQHDMELAGEPDDQLVSPSATAIQLTNEDGDELAVGVLHHVQAASD
ncbi:hypothetical protein SCUP515_02601 [Seiridium cupressi]